MFNKPASNNHKEKFLCYCSKVTHSEFRNQINSYYKNNLDALCKKLKLARHCAACLPNVEDEFFKLKGVNNNLFNLTYNSAEINLKNKIKNFIDPIFGYKLVHQDGYLPMLASKSIKTWLIVSNEMPNIIKCKLVCYSIKIIIYNSKGKNVSSLKKIVKPNQRLQICLNDYIPKVSDILDNYYVFVRRKPMEKGLRGSTRPHFYYETNKSMASLHTQDGGRKINIVDILPSKKEEKKLLFIINPSKKEAVIETILQRTFKKKLKNKKVFTIYSQGSKILDVTNYNEYIKKNLLICRSSVKVKCYFIIADKKFDYISVDHI